MTLVDDAFRGLAGLIGIPELWIRAVILVGLGFLLAGLASWILRRFVMPLTRRTNTAWDDFFVTSIRKPIMYTLIFFGILLGTRLVVDDPAYDLTFERTITTALLIIWAFGLGQFVVLFLGRMMAKVQGAEAAPTETPVLARITKITIGVVIGLTLLTVWDLNVTPLLASAGLVGIALAFAAQDTLANFFAGIAIYMDRPFRSGDYVVLDPGSASELRGEVRDIGLRSTRVLTRDDVLVTVPNNIIANGRVVNETGNVDRYRIRVAVGVAYDSDLDHVERTLVGLAKQHDKVLPDPEPRGRVRAFGDSSINWEVLAWIRDPRDRGVVIHDLSKKVHKAFRDEGIKIPFPQRDVHIDGRVERGSGDSGE